MRILVFGETGQVACELARFDEVMNVGRAEADLSAPASCASTIRSYAPDAVINAAAYTAVDRCEDEEDEATVINGLAPTAMAQACADLDIPFVHISSDYVFDGQGTRPFRPSDKVAPLNAYGRSKLVGEKGVTDAGGVYCILRTSWVFSAHGNNFVRTMLRLSETHEALSIVADQVGGPTAASAIAQACMTIVYQLREHGRSISGVHHLSGAPDVSWATLARAIFAISDRHVDVADISTAEYLTPAKRPLNSRLDCSQLEQTFGIERPDWRRNLVDIISELGVPALGQNYERRSP